MQSNNKFFIPATFCQIKCKQSFIFVKIYFKYPSKKNAKTRLPDANKVLKHQNKVNVFFVLFKIAFDKRLEL